MKAPGTPVIFGCRYYILKPDVLLVLKLLYRSGVGGITDNLLFLEGMFHCFIIHCLNRGIYYRNLASSV